ncbi:uncharacterized protein LOC108204032 isoform X1 [Daucus carota subsp. sativus]|uniref:uncharacterized protein LOC108204032 isoform X1 n=1 Tax=Daucus carota subsp. sativus TaxID=79200 RepID=UPI0007EF9E30|nr:PREDICTED: hydrogen cyanide synthase subunit HcnC [Daucus carota subsp. sativus]
MAAALISQSLIKYTTNNNDNNRFGSSFSSIWNQSSLFNRLPPSTSLTFCSKTRYRPRQSGSLAVVSAFNSYDVVIVGAGIIGLTIAHQLLLHSDLSVAVVDAAVPCAGATGAGQGYIWMVHKTPGTQKWELASRSRLLWEEFAQTMTHQGLDPLHLLGWNKTGSLLVGKTAQESVILKQRVDELSKAGLKAQFLSATELLVQEPALALEKEGGAAFLPDDYQLDARQTVAYIEKINRQYTTAGRYREYYHEPVKCLLRSGSRGEITAVQTSKNTLFSKKAVVIATGCWTGSLMPNLIRDLGVELSFPVKPRKGHLLVIKNFDFFKLNHGLMEAGYVGHQNATLESAVSGPLSVNHAEFTSISMTATMDTMGNLILGSSRQILGFNTDVDESIINCIWERAGVFFPCLQELSLKSLSERRNVRVGLRPYMPDGKPVIGPVPGLSNVFVAAGHEGEGLTLAMGTAEMITDMVLGNHLKVDHKPYVVQS